MKLRIRGGMVIGRSHLTSFRNSQDSFAIRERSDEGGTLTVGVISDGCGSAPKSEFGAHLVSSFVAEKLVSAITDGKLLPRVSMVAIWLRGVMKNLMANFTNSEEFLATHLLATCLGIVANENECLVFHRGDGYIFIGDAAIELDEGNAPNYPAYDAIKKQWWDGSDMNVLEVDLSKTRRVAVATDGFEPDLIDIFWGKEHPNGVQRQLNMLSRKKHFADDATIITLEVVEEVEEEDEGGSGREGV